MKEYIENRIKINNEPVIADDKTRRELIEHVQQTVSLFLTPFPTQITIS